MLTMVQAPQPFVTLEEAKKHLQIVHNRDDQMITSQIASAIGYFDGPNGYLGACIAPQDWLWKTGSFTDPLRIPLGPVLSVASVSYINAEAVVTTLAAGDFYAFADEAGHYLRPVDAWPSDVADRDDAVSVTFNAGRVIIPDQLKSAVLLLVGQLYRHREIDVDVRTFPTSFGALHLAHPYRASL